MMARQHPQPLVVHVVIEADGARVVLHALGKLDDRDLAQDAVGQPVAQLTAPLPYTADDHEANLYRQKGGEKRNRIELCAVTSVCGFQCARCSPL